MMKIQNENNIEVRFTEMVFSIYLQLLSGMEIPQYLLCQKVKSEKKKQFYVSTNLKQLSIV